MAWQRLRYTTSHPARHERGSDRGARRGSKLMPYLHLPFQAGRRSHPRRDEPQAHRARLSRPRRAHPRRPARDRALDRHHRRLPRRDGGGVRGDARARRARSGLRRPIPSSTAPAPARRRATSPTRSPTRSRRSGWRACKSCSSASRPRSTQRCVGRTLPVLFEKPGRHPGQLVGRSPYLQAVHAEAGPEHAGPHPAC